jgi:hypothetical protein
VACRGSIQVEALRLVSTRIRKAIVRHQIGRGLFDEARYRDAAAELEWACVLYRTAGRNHVEMVSWQARQRAKEVHPTR